MITANNNLQIQTFMTESENRSSKLRFQDLVFLAGDVSNPHLLPSNTDCSVIHFEAMNGFYSSVFDEEEKYCEMFPLSKILWCVNAKTGECIDWSSDDELCLPKSLRHCASYKSGLCNQTHAKRLLVSRSADWTEHNQRNVTRYPANFREVIEWKAIQEAEVLSKLPRYTDSALEQLHTCEEPRVITECKVSDEGGSYQVISNVNKAWENLCGHRRDDVIGESLSFLQGPDTDPDVNRALKDAIADALDASVLIKNYKKNGEAFMNRARVVPMIDHSAGDKPTRFMASLAAAPCSVATDAALFGDRSRGHTDTFYPRRLFPGDTGTPESLEF